MHLDQLEESVKGALRHINHMVMDTEEEWSMIATNQATHIVATAVAHRDASAQSGIQDKIAASAAAQQGYNEAATNPQASCVVVTHTAAVQAQPDRDHHDKTGPTAKPEAQKEVATITSVSPKTYSLYK